MRISAQKDAAWRICGRQNVWRHNLMLPDSTNLCVYPHGIGRSCCIPHDFVWLQALNPADLQIQNRADIGTEWCSSTEDYAIYRTLSCCSMHRFMQYISHFTVALLLNRYKIVRILARNDAALPRIMRYNAHFNAAAYKGLCNISHTLLLLKGIKMCSR